MQKQYAAVGLAGDAGTSTVHGEKEVDICL